MFVHLHEPKSDFLRTKQFKAFFDEYALYETNFVSEEGDVSMKLITNSKIFRDMVANCCNQILPSHPVSEPSLTDMIKQALRKELVRRKILFVGRGGPVCQDEREVDYDRNILRRSTEYFYDSTNGEEIDPQLVREAKEDEKE